MHLMQLTVIIFCSCKLCCSCCWQHLLFCFCYCVLRSHLQISQSLKLAVLIQSSGMCDESTDELMYFFRHFLCSEPSFIMARFLYKLVYYLFAASFALLLIFCSEGKIVLPIPGEHFRQFNRPILVALLTSCHFNRMK